MILFLEILSGICFFLGIISILIGSIGIIKLPDVFSRLHASGMIDTAGVAFIIFGMVLQSGLSITSIKLILIGVFIFFSSPISGHAVSLVSNSMGIKPKARFFKKQISVK